MYTASLACWEGGPVYRLTILLVIISACAGEGQRLTSRPSEFLLSGQQRSTFSKKELPQTVKDIVIPKGLYPELVITVMNWWDPGGNQGERMQAWVNDAGRYAGKPFLFFGM